MCATLALSIILLQDTVQMKHISTAGKFLLVTWIFCVILLREFYNSSLYSFLTQEPDTTDVPQSILALLDQNNVDFITPRHFHYLIGLTLFSGIMHPSLKIPTQLEKFYLKLLPKSSTVSGFNGVRYIQSMLNISRENPIKILRYDQTSYEKWLFQNGLIEANILK